MNAFYKNTCCFTGHRKIPADELMPLAERLEDEIVRLIQLGAFVSLWRAVQLDLTQ